MSTDFVPDELNSNSGGSHEGFQVSFLSASSPSSTTYSQEFSDGSRNFATRALLMTATAAANASAGAADSVLWVGSAGPLLVMQITWLDAQAGSIRQVRACLGMREDPASACMPCCVFHTFARPLSPSPPTPSPPQQTISHHQVMTIRNTNAAATSLSAADPSLRNLAHLRTVLPTLQRSQCWEFVRFQPPLSANTVSIPPPSGTTKAARAAAIVSAQGNYSHPSCPYISQAVALGQENRVNAFSLHAVSAYARASVSGQSFRLQTPTIAQWVNSSRSDEWDAESGNSKRWLASPIFTYHRRLGEASVHFSRF